MTSEIPTEMREQLTLLTTDQVCELLQVKKAWLWEKCRKGEFPHMRLSPRDLRFRPDEVRAWINGTWLDDD